MFDQIFLSPQIKQSMIMTNKHRVHDISHEWPNDFRLGITGN